MPARSRVRMAAIIAALFLSQFVAALDQTVVATAIPTITAHLHSAAGYTWIGGAYLLAKAAALPVWAKLSDIWGRKPFLLAGLALFFLSSILCAVSHSMAMLIAARALQGVGGGGLQQLVSIIISDIFSLRQRSLFFGLADVLWAVAGGVGPLIGGALAEFVGWRWAFWINLPVVGVAFLLSAAFVDVHNPRTQMKQGLQAVDWFGATSVVGLTVLLLLGLDFGGVIFPWSSPKVVCLLLVGMLMASFFVFCERRLAAYPIMPMRLFEKKSNIASVLSCFTEGFVFIAGEFFLPLYFQSVKGASPTHSGLLLLPLISISSLTAVANGIYIHRTGEYLWVLRLGMMVMTLGVGLYMLLNIDTSTATIIGLEALTGVGVGLVFQPPLISMQAHVIQDDTATATATLGFVRNIATALSVIIGGIIFQNSMELRADDLTIAGVPDSLAAKLSGSKAGASVELVGEITNQALQRTIREAFAWSLRNMWILYTCVSGCGIITSLFVSRATLSDEHTETRTGIKKTAARAGMNDCGIEMSLRSQNGAVDRT